MATDSDSAERILTELTKFGINLEEFSEETRRFVVKGLASVVRNEPDIEVVKIVDSAAKEEVKKTISPKGWVEAHHVAAHIRKAADDELAALVFSADDQLFKKLWEKFSRLNVQPLTARLSPEAAERIKALQVNRG